MKKRVKTHQLESIVKSLVCCLSARFNKNFEEEENIFRIHLDNSIQMGKMQDMEVTRESKFSLLQKSVCVCVCKGLFVNCLLLL